MNVFTLPANFTANIASTASSVIGDFSEPLTLIVGILIAVTAIAILIRLFHR